MSEHDIDKTLTTVHLHDGPFSRTNTINVRSAMSKIHKISMEECRETGRPLGECARDHAYTIMLDHLENNYPRENGQWVHRPNFGWVFEKEDNSECLNHSWKRSEHADNMSSSMCTDSSSYTQRAQGTPVVIRTAQEEDSYINSIKPKPIIKTPMGINNQTFIKSKRVNRFANCPQDIKGIHDYEYYSDDELEDIPAQSPQSIQNMPKRPAGFNIPVQTQNVQSTQNDDDGLPISDIQKLFMNVFNKKP